MPDPSYYETLEIPIDATPDEVREAYRLLAMVWHPDRFPKDSKLWTHANERMQQINEAYNALKNIQESSPRPAAESSSTPNTQPSTEWGQSRTGDSSPSRGPARDQDSDASWQRIEDQKRRIEEQKRREAEQRQREAEKRQREVLERQSVESEHRRTEADRLRVLMKGKQRVEDIQHERAAKGLCQLCGKPMGALDKLARRTRHRDCTEFIDSPSSG